MGKKQGSDSEAIETISAAGDANQQQMRLEIDDSGAPVLYSSTVRVWGSAEEIHLDFAGPLRAGAQPKTARLKIDQRVTLNPWAAKRLAIALTQAIRRYETAYGPLELDERRRRVGGGAAGGGGESKPTA